jgi:hypothetical protein
MKPIKTYTYATNSKVLLTLLSAPTYYSNEFHFREPTGTQCQNTIKLSA